MKSKHLIPALTVTATLLMAGLALVFPGEVFAQEEPEQAGPSPNPNFDFTGIDRFWEMVEILETDREPTKDQWQALLATPGYRALTTSEFPADFFVECFSLVFKPSRRQDLEQALEDPSRKRYLRHYLEVGSQRSELARQRRKLESEPVMTQALPVARSFLPQDLPSTEPPVAYVIFANDGRGYEPIVIDLLATLTLDLENYLAHESHHWYRNRLRVYDPAKVAPEDEYLVHTLDQIQAEGIADLIDKAGWVFGEHEPPESRRGYAKRYREVFAETPGLLTAADSLIQVISDAPAAERERIGKQIADLIPMSGHPTGLFMTRVILEELGHARLVANVGNPFAFCRDFQEAVNRSSRDMPRFSEDTLRYLHALESRYVDDS